MCLNYDVEVSLTTTDRSTYLKITPKTIFPTHDPTLTYNNYVLNKCDHNTNGKPSASPNVLQMRK